ncbi:MAG: endonuclease [Alicyclobacillus sp.]|nr:endonuclease [Alicyclobacillus sp.]
MAKSRETDNQQHLLPRARGIGGPQLRRELMDIYNRMFEHFGDRKWWPAETVEEVVIGAILVQGVAWSNTVKAIDNLRQRGLLTIPALHRASAEEVETCIVPTRYFRMKAKKLKAFAAHVEDRYGGDLAAMFDQPLEPLRTELLGIYGIGRETADDIVLYAAGKASFVIDSYTKRIFHRLGYTAEEVPYEWMRAWFMDHLPADPALYNQYHALIDAVGHHFCSHKQPLCAPCPLRSLCDRGQTADLGREAEESAKTLG